MSFTPSVAPRPVVALLLLVALVAGGFVLATPATAGAAPVASSAKAGKASSVRVSYRAADRAFVRTARRLVRCQGTVGRCRALHRALQRRGQRLERQERQLGRLARRARVRRLRAQLQAPVLVADGGTLRWSRVGRVTTYVLATKVPGQRDRYAVVRGTSTSPRAVPGVTVDYSVRTAVTGSRWASEVSISHPGKDEPPSDPAPAPTREAADSLPAPELRVEGTTLRWGRVADVDRYVLVAKLQGRGDRYWTTVGLSATPDAIAGRTVTYSVRADVPGSAWADEVEVAYPATTTPAPAPAPATSPAPAPAPKPAPAPTPAPAPAPPSEGFTAGIVAGSAVAWELRFVTALGARSARMEFPVGTPASQLEPYVDAYARAGVRPLLLAGFHGRTPTAAEAANVASWAAAFGPGGTFWQGKSYPAGVAVTVIEFGNESSYSYQYPTISGNSNWANTSFYRDVATQYARRFKEAHVAIQGANPNVGLLAVGDSPGNWTTWMDAMFDAVPDLAQRVAGWTVHPYGPDWKSRIDGTLANARRQGAPETIPVYVTENGIASDDGRCLGDNYGWDKCMTYQQAGNALTQSIAAMRSRYGSRLRAVYHYHAHDLKHPGASNDREAYFGALKLDGSSKGELTAAVRAFLASSD